MLTLNLNAQNLVTFSSNNTLTLTDALDKAISLSPEIKEKEERYEEIYYDVKIATSGYFPKIDFLATTDLKDSSTTNLDENGYEVGLLLTQNIFNGFKDINKHKLELAKYGSALYTTKELVNSFSLKVIEAYLSLLKEKRMLEIQHSSLVNHENIFKKIMKKYNAGMGTQLELRLSETSLNLAKINYHEQKNSHKQVKIALERYLNEDINLYSLTYPSNKVIVPTSVESALEIAYESHPSMYVAKLNKQLSDYELAYTKKDFYPSLDLKARYTTGENGIYQNIDEYYRMYLELSYNLYNGSSDFNEKEKIKKKIAQKNEIIKKVKLDISNKVKSNYDEYIMLEKKKILLDKYVISKELTLESYYSQFSIGKANLRDILDTTESLYIAKKSQLDGDFDLLLSSYSVIEAMGSLPKISYHNKKVIEAKKEENQDNSIFKDIKKVDKKNCFVVTASKLNVRKKMTTSSKIVDSYKKDEEVCAEKMEHQWIQTKDGWVSKVYLAPIKKGSK